MFLLLLYYSWRMLDVSRTIPVFKYSYQKSLHLTYINGETSKLSNFKKCINQATTLSFSSKNCNRESFASHIFLYCYFVVKENQRSSHFLDTLLSKWILVQNKNPLNGCRRESCGCVRFIGYAILRRILELYKRDDKNY